jgi:prepilin-type N-terminal cleavage/methylation domain-containing protein
MLKHKRGFTLVELLIVVALLGFGAVALANLFQSALRTFNKTEERYIKQEAVKAVAEYLQTATNIGAAIKAEIYPDASVVPTGTKIDDAYAYVYVEKKDLLPKDEPDGVYDGYYLYKLERGQTREEAVCLNEEVPLYITFNVYQDEDYAGAGNVRNQCGIKVNIAAVDSDFDYGKVGDAVETNEALNARIKDYVFYDMDVSYHFPNMVANNDQFRVNYTGTEKDTATVYDMSIATSPANIRNGSYEAVDFNGQVLKISSDSSISADDAAAAISVSSFCFIATAGFGEATGEVGILCDFRDQCLKTNPLGRMFVKAYYTVSPPIADFIAEHETLKEATRVALKPLVAVAVYALEPELLIDQLPFVIMGIGAFGGIVAVAVVRRRNSKLKIKN